MMVLDPSSVPAVVLVVEDEMLLRMRAVDMVEDAGYTSRRGGRCRRSRHHPGSPGPISRCCSPTSRCPVSMDGLKLAHAVHDRWPPIKIILVSGSSSFEHRYSRQQPLFRQAAGGHDMIAEMQYMIGHA